MIKTHRRHSGESRSPQKHDGFRLTPAGMTALWLLMPFGSVFSQGFLPPQTSSSTAKTDQSILIGSKIPESLTVLDGEGKKRSVLSYKSALDVLVVGFFSAGCSENGPQWRELKRLEDNYADWRVIFIAVNVGDTATRDELVKQMQKVGLQIPLLEDVGHAVAHAVLLEKVPELVVIDEVGDLRYTGPFGKDSRTAIEAVIGHVSPVPNPEPTNPAGCPVL